MKKDERHACPHCGEACDRESVDVGVGVMCGPWGCGNCGWSEDPTYDSRVGVRRDGDDRVLDQYGVSHHVDRLDGAAVLAGLNVEARGADNKHKGCGGALRWIAHGVNAVPSCATCGLVTPDEIEAVEAGNETP